MSYFVLARKYRPANFDEVIGQAHITDLLKSAIQSGKIAHAYLFCGPRGIGKTSCARILAKTLNCTKGPTLDPCNQCTACQEIAKGTSFDVLEIDGASNRGIDEIRTLRENVKFAPSYGRYKIYIVDEVHMLTTEAFNALLKTLEEPPEHVKFIFATTDINKVPETIISRCQRFDFKRIPLKMIMQLLEDISRKEKLQVDTEAFLAIAKAGQGSLRDALSILDQLSAMTGQQIKASDVTTMLGTVEVQLLFEVVEAIGDKNCVGALQVLDRIIEQGKDIKQLTKDLLEHFRNLMVLKVGGKTLGKLIDYPLNIKEMLLTQSGRFSLKEILKAIDILIETQETSRITETVRIPLEIAFAKLTYSAEGLGSLSAQKSEGPLSKKDFSKNISTASSDERRKSSIEVFASPKEETEESTVEDEQKTSEEMGGSSTIDRTTAEVDLDKIRKTWDALTYAVSREKMSLATYLQEGMPIDFKMVNNIGKLTIGFSKTNHFHKESLESRENLQRVEHIFSEKLKTKLRIEYRIVEEIVEPKEDEPLIKTALETFNGKVVQKWHKE